MTNSDRGLSVCVCLTCINLIIKVHLFVYLKHGGGVLTSDIGVRLFSSGGFTYFIIKIHSLRLQCFHITCSSQQLYFKRPILLLSIASHRLFRSIGSTWAMYPTGGFTYVLYPVQWHRLRFYKYRLRGSTKAWHVLADNGHSYHLYGEKFKHMSVNNKGQNDIWVTKGTEAKDSM